MLNICSDNYIIISLFIKLIFLIYRFEYISDK